MHNLLPITSLFLLCATLPFLDLGFLAWIALIPLFIFIQKDSTTLRSAILWSGAVVGGYVLCLLWPLTTVNVWWWISPESFMYQYKSLILISTVSIVSVYAGFGFGALFAFMYKKKPYPLVAGIAWGILELIRVPFVYDFTWGKLAYSQHSYSFILSITSFVGVIGLSAIIVLINALCAQLLLSKKYRYVVYIFFIFTGIYAYGFFTASPHTSNTLSVTSLHLEERTQDLYEKNTTDQVLVLIENELKKNPDILVTPENLFPFLVLNENFEPITRSSSKTIPSTFSTLLRLSQQYPNTSITLGVHTRTPHLQNSVIVLENGLVTDYYHKQKLLIFGERPPLAFDKSHIMPFVSGNKDTMRIKNYETIPLICSEIATTVSRSSDTQLIINISNDSIFDSSLVGKQNLFIAQVLSARHNAFTIRSGKGGVSALINNDGAILSERTTTGFISSAISF